VKELRKRAHQRSQSPISSISKAQSSSNAEQAANQESDPLAAYIFAVDEEEEDVPPNFFSFGRESCEVQSSARQGSPRLY